MIQFLILWLEASAFPEISLVDVEFLFIFGCYKTGLGQIVGRWSNFLFAPRLRFEPANLQKKKINDTIQRLM